MSNDRVNGADPLVNSFKEAERATQKWIQSFRHHEEFSDVTVLVGAEAIPFKLHRLIICTKSPYLHAACIKNFRQGQPLVFTIKDIKPSLFDKVVKWIYQEGFEIPRLIDALEFMEVHYLAGLLKMQDMQSEMQEVLAQKVLKLKHIVADSAEWNEEMLKAANIYTYITDNLPLDSPIWYQLEDLMYPILAESVAGGFTPPPPGATVELAATLLEAQTREQKVAAIYNNCCQYIRQENLLDS